MYDFHFCTTKSTFEEIKSFNNQVNKSVIALECPMSNTSPKSQSLRYKVYYELAEKLQNKFSKITDGISMVLETQQDIS